MKKVAIVTLNGYFNYGNRLQNYALQEIIKNLGFEVETLINNTKLTENKNRNIKKYEKIKNKNLNDLYNAITRRLERKLYRDRLKARSEIFKDFSLNYINETKFNINEEIIPDDLASRYDFFVTGSDQVWNPHSRKGSFIEFLTFVPQEKRIAYAPSFGVSKIPNKYIQNYQKWLSEIPHLSVREEAGAEIIKQLTGRNSPVLLDPTMVLTREQWLSVSKQAPNKPKANYLLTYFLGDISKERKNKLKKIAKKNNLEIVHLSQINHKEHYLSGPSEFIDYINSASVFCTDSFHGAAFSIILETPFIIYNREANSPSMNSRLDTLLKKFKLEDRVESKIISNEQVFNINLSDIQPIIEAERNKSIRYLKNALS